MVINKYFSINKLIKQLFNNLLITHIFDRSFQQAFEDIVQTYMDIFLFKAENYLGNRIDFHLADNIYFFVPSIILNHIKIRKYDNYLTDSYRTEILQIRRYTELYYYKV